MSTPSLAPCCQCDSTNVTGRHKIAPVKNTRELLIAYRIICNSCKFSTKEFAGCDLNECRTLAENYWNRELPRSRLKFLERQLRVVAAKSEQTKQLAKQKNLPF